MALQLGLRPWLRPAPALGNERLAIFEGVRQRAVGHAREVDHSVNISAGVGMVEKARFGAATRGADVGVVAKPAAGRGAADRIVEAVAQADAEGAVGDRSIEGHAVTPIN